MFRVDARIDRHFLDRPVERFLRHPRELRTRNGSPVFNDAELSRNDCGGFRMIAGNHHRADASALRAGDGFFRFLARRIDHADQTREYEISLDALIDFTTFECGRRQRAEGDAERAQRFAGQCFVAPQDFRPTLRRQSTALFSDQLLRTTREQYIRRALGKDEQALLPLRIRMNRGHQLALGGEGHLLHGRACLAVAAADEHAFELFTLELERDLRLAAHSISFASSASLATLFMLRAVPEAAAGILSFDCPWPLG